MARAETIVHASCVAWQDRAVLILGASGTGKSALALQLMAFGCALVADDRTRLEHTLNGVLASCPEAIEGLIEARGVGLLRAAGTGPQRVSLAIDLDHEEQARLPELRKIELLGHSVPLLHAVKSPHFAASVLQLLRAGRQETDSC